ncbi:hypothetical protein [Streptomyces sp. NPDC046909]|uniref:hypothetical protein n=1 Tax=Streptomyces sp. NPDC046909 TaxID=3155617 RepID=UPI0033EDE5E2
MTSRDGNGTAQAAPLVMQMLGEMAERLETHRPEEPFTPAARIAVIQATTMDPSLARALRLRAPEVTQPVTRGEYAARLREAAAGQPSSKARRVAALHEECRRDYAEGRRQQDVSGHRDDAHLIAGVSESARARTENDL